MITSASRMASRNIVGQRARRARCCASSRGSSEAGPHSTISRAEFRKQIDVGARHAAVRDVADDGHAQAFQAGAAVENGARVEQRLGGMLVRAVAGVDDGHGQMARQKMRRAGGRSGASRWRSGAWPPAC